ncbi:MarR family transcriptional regulator, partial [Priestia megaterium]
MENSKNNIVNLERKLVEAEKNARLRELETEKEKAKADYRGVDQDEVNQAMETLSQATGKDIFIGTKRTPQSRVRFVQTLQGNQGYLNKKEYFTGREKVFLHDIVPYIAFSTNCIVLDIKAKNPVPANISEIAKLINSNR